MASSKDSAGSGTGPDWIRLVVEPGPVTAERVETALDLLGAEAVTWEDAADDPILEPGVGETPAWEQTRVIGLFPGHADTKALGEDLPRLLPAGQTPPFRFERLADRNWETAWAEEARPLCFGDRLWFCPGEECPPIRADQSCLRLPPGLAFGTGTHPTTALCLAWLCRNLQADSRVLDYGCGSGVLALGAAALGAQQVTATDNDPQALQATRDNAAANALAERIDTRAPDQLDLENGPAYDSIVANILAGPLIQLAPELKTVLRPGGNIALAGLLEEQADEIIQAYTPEVRLSVQDQDGDWVLLAGVRGNE